MISVIQPQINIPPQYLTSLWTTRIWPAIAQSYLLPNARSNPDYPNYPGKFKPDFDAFYKVFAANNAHYLVNGAYNWEYTFTFSWDATRTLKTLMKSED